MSAIKNKHILITGGASGIGRLMAQQMLKKQARKVIIWDIDNEKLDELSRKFSNHQHRLLTYPVDVSDPDQIYATAEKVLEQVAGIDILINNAGIVVGKPLADQSAKEIQRTIAINLLGVIHTARAFLPDMQRQGSGHIVNIASAAGLMGNPRMSVYAGSKWGIIGWSESLRLELEQQESGIRVTTVEPSFINTGMFAGVKPPLLTPLLEPIDIANKIIRAIDRNAVHLRAPFMVKFLPFLKGVLPTRAFDFVAGKLFRVYHSMDTFTGRTDN